MENIHALMQVQKDTEEIENIIKLEKIFYTKLAEKQNIAKQLDITVANLKKNLKSIDPTVEDQEQLNNQLNAIIDNALSKINTIAQDHQVMKIKFKSKSCECSRVNMLTQQLIESFQENSKDMKKSIALAKIKLENNIKILSNQTNDFKVMKEQQQLEFTSDINKKTSLEEKTTELINQLKQIEIATEAIHNEIVNEDVTKEKLQMEANSTRMELIDSQKISTELETFTKTLQNEFDKEATLKTTYLENNKDNQDKLQKIKHDFEIQINNYNKICKVEGLHTYETSLFLSNPSEYYKKLFQTIEEYNTLQIQEQNNLNCEVDASHSGVVECEKELARLSEKYKSIQTEIECNTEIVEELKKYSSEYLNIQNEIPLKQAYLSQLIAENEAKELTNLLAHKEMKQMILQKQSEIKQKAERAKKTHDFVIKSFEDTIHSLKFKYERYDMYFNNKKRKIAGIRKPITKRVSFNEVVYTREPSTEGSEETK